MTLLLSVFFVFSAQAESVCGKDNRLFYFNMPIVIGKKVFNDQVEICKGKKGLYGQLEVPKRFKAKLENIKLNGQQLSFSITANEGRGKFKVFYAGELKNNQKHFLGMARLEKNKVLGPFLGINSKGPEKLEIVQ